MSILRNLIVLFIVGAFLWHLYGDSFEQAGFIGVYEDVRDDLHEIWEHPVVSNSVDWVKQEVQYLADRLSDQQTEDIAPSSQEKPSLSPPSEQTFSIHNIVLGDDRNDVEDQVGEPKRTSRNEYGVDWVAYHESYQNFIMVSYNEQDKVNAMYTNHDLLSSSNGLTFASTRDEVLSVMPKPLKALRKGLINYQIQDNGEFNMFKLDDSYVTFFYDKHQGSKVTSILIIDEELEEQKRKYFAEPDQQLREGLEYVLFDLTNSTRVKFGLPALEWNESARETVRAHSEDMAEQSYFSHTNLQGQSPFDRLTEDAISYRIAGENLATGQPSSIFAHEGLMNSLGHREHKLRNGYESLSVGVAFDKNSQPYYTENYLAD